MNTKHTIWCLQALTYQADAADINWVEDMSGDWFNNTNWVQDQVPLPGDRVLFTDSQIFDPPLEVNIDNAGLGVVQFNDSLLLNDKIVFVDASAGGQPEDVDDGLFFDVIQANGGGGVEVVFNVPVTANLMSSIRHGAVFNQPFSIDVIEAISKHQDKWQLNAPGITPIKRLFIDEDRGPDGDTIDGFFQINADQTINDLELVWGSLQVGPDVTLTIGHLIYHVFTEQPDNNNLSPIIIGENSRIQVEKLSLIDVLSGDVITTENGTLGSADNPDVDINSPIVEGAGIIVVCGPSIFANNFDQSPETCGN
ncbi:hypothetical protein ACFODZ_10615 [Marinicella sediminis]|uniref:Uncharacterized protein n=1 Tax=Marinicella sediminis TaxID=1792834 RepID=A0ABV7J969_9GAMM|nr:hypothetical protein [Marinicella sediminis]